MTKLLKKELRRLLSSLIFSITVFSLLVYPGMVSGDEMRELDGELEETVQEIEQAERETSSAEKELEQSRLREEQLGGSISYYEFQLSLAQQQLKKLGIDITEKEATIAENLRNAQLKSEQILQYKQSLFSQARQLYKSHFTDSLEIYFLTPDDLEGARLAVLHQAVIENLRREIYLLNDQVKDLEEKRYNLESEREDLQRDRDILIDQKKKTEANVDVAQKKVLAARAEQQQLMQHLAGLTKRLQELTKKEQQILAQKAAAALAATTVGEIEITRSAIASPPPQDGNVYFSFWAYGYPHRVGMSQYGAYGRAKSGQGYRKILKTYYQGVMIEEQEMPEKIKIIDGEEIREIDFETDYLLGIGEMPSCWGSAKNGGLEALKAQAVAARSYALKYTNWGKSPICIDQKCQVYVGDAKVSKLCGNFWEQAVKETKGQVILYEGDVISAWYASTAGGYTLSAKEVWGTEVPYAHGIKDADAQGRFYDEISPWYHKAWGDQPWLSRDQVEDLLNAALLPASYDAHLPTVENGGFSFKEVLTALSDEGTSPIVNLKSLEVIGAETESTLLLRAYYEQGYVDIEAQRFRFVFNLRSPGTDAIWTSRFDIRTS